VQLLRQAGVKDPLWLEVVAEHHRGAAGAATAPPLRRDTELRAHAVRRGLATRELSVRVQHERVLSC
jgi:hypothetical protein